MSRRIARPEVARAHGYKRVPATPTAMARSDGLREHLLVVTIPIALEPLGGIILPFRTKKLGELRIARLHLFPGSPAMVGQIISTVAANGHVNEAPEGVRCILQPLRCVQHVQIEDHAGIRLARPLEEAFP